jgi:hypothetical protein
MFIHENLITSVPHFSWHVSTSIRQIFTINGFLFDFTRVVYSNLFPFLSCTIIRDVNIVCTLDINTYLWPCLCLGGWMRLLTVETLVYSQLTLYESRCGWSGNGEGSSPRLLNFPTLIIIPAFFHSHVSPPCEVCDARDQAGHYHILSLYIWEGGYRVRSPYCTLVYISVH